MAYKEPTSVNVTEGIGELLPYLRDVTNGWLPKMLVMALFFIFGFGYLTVNKDDYKGAFAVSSYITFVISTFLWIAGFVGGWTYGIVVGLTTVSTAILLITD